MSILYELEFNFIPNLFRKDKAAFFLNVLDQKERYFLKLFNRAYKLCAPKDKKIEFKEKEFSYYDCNFGSGRHIIGLGLPTPRKKDCPSVHCFMYLLAYRVHNNTTIEVMDLYNLEVSELGTTCIGKNVDGTHYNYGAGCESFKETFVEAGRIIFNDDSIS